MVLELHELGYQVYFKNFRCQRQVPRWTKKMGYSSSLSSSTPKSGRCLIISQTVLLGQIFLQLMLMGHFGPYFLQNGVAYKYSIQSKVLGLTENKSRWVAQNLSRLTIFLNPTTIFVFGLVHPGACWFLLGHLIEECGQTHYCRFE